MSKKKIEDMTDEEIAALDEGHEEDQHPAEVDAMIDEDRVQDVD